MTRMRTAALIVAAGSGTRFGGDQPKQLALLGGKPLLRHAIEAFATHPGITDMLIVGEAAELGAAAAPHRIVAGGDTRRASVAAGLATLAEQAPDRVLIHDAARPLVPHAVIDRLVAALDMASGAIPALPAVDTMVRRTDGTTIPVDRDGVFRVQTPQAFRFATVVEAHHRWNGAEPSDDAMMVRAMGEDVAIVLGDTRLEKVTFADDLERMESSLARISVTGFGYDVHRLAPGEALWLAGVRIDHSHGLLGHSDADVALHALTDAILGAIGAGDIGSHFPPSDRQWRGAASDRFLTHARELAEAERGRIEHVDVTIVCEAPRIGPHRDAMRQRIAGLLRLPMARVSVKATTTERLGFTGRSEGIAAQAVATVSLPRSP